MYGDRKLHRTGTAELLYLQQVADAVPAVPVDPVHFYLICNLSEDVLTDDIDGCPVVRIRIRSDTAPFVHLQMSDF